MFSISRLNPYLMGLLMTATLAVSCLLWVENVSAIQQPVIDTSYAGTNNWGSAWQERFISPPETFPTTTIASVSVYVEATTHLCTDWILKLTNTSLATLNSATRTIPIGVPGWYDFTFATSVNFHTGNLRQFYGDTGAGSCAGGDHDITYYGAANTSTYPNGFFTNASQTTTPYTVKNQAFIINGSDPVSQIDFYFSGSFPTSTCDFSLWPTQAYISDEDTALYGGNIGAVVEWGTNELGQQFSDSVGCAQSDNYIPGTASSTCSAPNFGVRKSAPLVPGQAYWAYPYLKAPLDDYRQNFASYDSSPLYTVAEGTGWNFIISGQPNENGCQAISLIYPDFSWPFVTSTLSDNPYGGDWCDGIDESGIVGQLKSAACQSAQFLFRPSEDSLNNFSALKETISAKPPFGYFAVYNSALSGLENSTSTTSTIASNSSTPQLQLSTWTGLLFFQYVYTAVEWVFYLLTAFYIYKRFKNFSFHG